MTVINVTTPAAVMDLDLIKSHLRIDGTQDDTTLAVYLAAATTWLENATGQLLSSRTVDIKMDSWPEADLELPVWPVTALTSVTYTDIDGSDTVLGSSVYLESLDHLPARLVLKSGQTWPTVELQEADAIVIRCTAGHSGDIPDMAQQVILLLIGLWYENRESLSPTYLKSIPQGIDSMVWALHTGAIS